MRPDEYAARVQLRREELEMMDKGQLLRLARGHVLFVTAKSHRDDLVKIVLTGEFPLLSWNSIMEMAFPLS
jgi:hypothetical protein